MPLVMIRNKYNAGFLLRFEIARTTEAIAGTKNWWRGCHLGTQCHVGVGVGGRGAPPGGMVGHPQKIVQF